MRQAPVEIGEMVKMLAGLVGMSLRNEDADAMVMMWTPTTKTLARTHAEMVITIVTGMRVNVTEARAEMVRGTARGNDIDPATTWQGEGSVREEACVGMWGRKSPFESEGETGEEMREMMEEVEEEMREEVEEEMSFRACMRSMIASACEASTSVGEIAKESPLGPR